MYRCEGPPREPEIPDAARIAAGSAGYIRRVIRGPRTALVIVLAAWLALAPPAALAKKRKHRPAPCSLSGSKTLLQTRSARVFYRTARGTTTEYACMFARNKRFPLASGESGAGGAGDAASLETLSGSWVAFARGRFDDSTRYDPSFQGFPQSAVGINLSTGAQLALPAVGGNLSASTVSDLVLGRNGSFAWIGSGGGRIELHRLKAGDAADTVLDSGAGIQAGSLALGGDTLYWMKGGSVFTAPLG